MLGVKVKQFEKDVTMNRRIATVVLLCATILSAPTPASADDSRHAIVWKDTTAFRYNPLGLVSAAEFEYRLRMFNNSATLFNNYISLAATPVISPAFTRLGAKLEVMPLALLSLSVKYEYIQHFGTFDYLQSFPDQNADYSDAALKANADNGENYAGSGTQLSFGGLLQAAVGPVAVRTRATLFHTKYNVEPGTDTVVYDILLDNVLPADGWSITNELDVLYMRRALIAGVRHTFTRAFTEKIADDQNQAHHRLGPLILYEVYRKPKDRALNSIKVLGLFQWYLAHRYRTGQETTQALPYLGVGAIFEGTFL